MDVPEEQLRELRELRRMLQEAKTAAEYRRVQCVWMRKRLGMKAEEIAAATGAAKRTVYQTQSGYRHGGTLAGPGRGGRRNQHLTPEQETGLIAHLKRKARSGRVTAGYARLVLETAAGRPVHIATVYRLLGRHGATHLLRSKQ